MKGAPEIRRSGLLSFALEHPPAALRCCTCSGWAPHFLTRCVASHVPYPALHWLQTECFQILLQVCSLKVHGQVSRENSEDWVVGWFSTEQVKVRSKMCDKRIGWPSGDLEHISRDTSGTNIKGEIRALSKGWQPASPYMEGPSLPQGGLVWKVEEILHRETC